MIDLASAAGYTALPVSDPAALADWFHRGAQRGSLSEYLQGFAHTTAVMQTAAALERVACEFIEDMAADGVVYAEVRFAPVLHTVGGLDQDEVVQAVLRGLALGERRHGVRWGLLLCAMRHLKDSLETAELAIRWRDAGVVGLDLAVFAATTKQWDDHAVLHSPSISPLTPCSRRNSIRTGLQVLPIR